MAKVCKSDGQGTFAGTQGNGEVAPIPAVHAIEPPGSAPRSLSSYPGQSHFPLLWAAELRISVIQTRLTFQNSGPVNSNFPVRLLR